MIDTVVVATDGSRSVGRCVTVALDLADRFDAAVHALYVVDAGELEGAPESVREEMRSALVEDGVAATDAIAARSDADVTTAVRAGHPADTIVEYARDVGADVVATGTRGRHGENRLLVGSVAERVVRSAPMPVLTVRQVSAAEE